jgi:hypothetical protein
MFTRRVSLPGLAVFLLLAALFVSPSAVAAQGHEAGGHAAAPAAAGGAQPVEPANAEAAHGSEHPIRDLVAKLLNFGILVGILVYFLKTPIAGYLSGRSAQIRQDLITAAEMRRTATTERAAGGAGGVEEPRRRGCASRKSPDRRNRQDRARPVARTDAS